MVSVQLDLWGAEHTPPAHMPTAYRPHREDYKRRHTRLLRDGRHPMTGLAVRRDVTCKTCRFCVLRGGVAGRYYKCLQAPISGGPATDVRVGWPGCQAYEQREAGGHDD